MMSDKFRGSDPTMKITPATDDPYKQVSMDAAGNRPPKDGRANVKRSKIGKGKNDSPEAILYGDKSGDE